MREIKFRIWDKLNKRWYIQYPYAGSFFDVTKNGLFCRESEDDGYILVQYTGLKDKNGKEIYEGDIVKYEDVLSDDYILDWNSVTIGQVNWIEKRSQFILQDTQQNKKGGHYITHWEFAKNIEIIGNIYENPNLLKEIK